MSQETIVEQDKKELLTFEQLKKKALNELSSNNVVKFIREKENSVRKYLNNYSDELNENTIRENLTDDTKHILSDISENETNCYLGLYKLDEIEDNLKRFSKSDDFWKWAGTVTKVEPYSLQNRQLDRIILKSIDKFSEKEKIDKFDKILEITENNASSDSLKIFSKLVFELKQEIDEVNKRVKTSRFQKWEDYNRIKETDLQSIIQKTSRIFESINHIVEHHYRNNSYKFYFEMNPEEIKEICELSKSIESENSQIKWREPLLRNLITYYVSFAKEFASTADIDSLCDNWKLSEIFQIVYNYADDQNIELQEKILDSFSEKNEYLPYLPINIIESTFNQDNDEKQRKIIYYLENRYKLSSEKQKRIIFGLNEKIILDSSKAIEIREEAFNWIYNELENKENWCQSILTKLLSEAIGNDIEMSLQFVRIVKKCFDAIQDKNAIEMYVNEYMLSGRNEELRCIFYEKSISTNTENLQGLISKLIDDNNTGKIDEICKYLTDLMDCSLLDSTIGKKGIGFLCEKFAISNCQDSISDFMNKAIVGEQQSIQMKQYIAAHYISTLGRYYNEKPSIENGNRIRTVLLESDSIDYKEQLIQKLFSELDKNEESKKQFLSSYLHEVFSEKNSIELNLLLIREFVETSISTKDELQLEKYIEYIWKYKDKDNYKTVIRSILSSVCTSSNKKLIEYVIQKGWYNS